MVLQAQRHIRRGKQRGAVLLVEQQIEGIDADFGVAGHVWQVVVDLPHEQDRLPRRPAFLDHREQVEGDVRVTAQAEAIGMLVVAGHQLRHQVQTGGIDVSSGVAVVAADVILLGLFAVEQAAGLHEKLLNVDVGRQVVPVQAREEIRFG